MDDGQVTNRCACGWEVSGPLDDVVDATIEHGRRLHNMEATREQVIAAIRGAERPLDDAGLPLDDATAAAADRSA